MDMCPEVRNRGRFGTAGAGKSAWLAGFARLKMGVKCPQKAIFKSLCKACGVERTVTRAGATWLRSVAGRGGSIPR